ncbi:MAG: hypothetical protein ACREJ2_16765 [Planctomycetota bacterium]
MSGWSVDRVRQDIHGVNLVTAHFTLKNNLSSDLTDLALTIDYRDMGQSEKKTDVTHVARLKAGATVDEAIKQTWVPEFSDYLISIDYTADGKHQTVQWAGDSPQSAPEPYSDQPIPDVSKPKIVGQELTIERTWATGIEVIVKNLGALPAYGVQIQVTFTGLLNRRPVVMGTELLDFGSDAVPGGKTVKRSLRFKRPYNGYNDYKVRLVLKDVAAEVSMQGQDFANPGQLEAAQWDFQRTKKGHDLTIAGKLRNGLKDTVSDIKLTLTLTEVVPDTASHKHPTPMQKVNRNLVVKIAGPVAPGQTVPFTTDLLADSPQIEDLSTAFEYNVGAPPPAAPAGPTAGDGGNDGAAAGEAAWSDQVDIRPDSVLGNPDGSVAVQARVHNGTKSDVKNMLLVFVFTLPDGGSKKAEVPLHGTLKSGRTAKLNLSLPGIGAFTQYSYSAQLGE